MAERVGPVACLLRLLYPYFHPRTAVPAVSTRGRYPPGDPCGPFLLVPCKAQLGRGTWGPTEGATVQQGTSNFSQHPEPSREDRLLSCCFLPGVDDPLGSPPTFEWAENMLDGHRRPFLQWSVLSFHQFQAGSRLEVGKPLAKAQAPRASGRG